MHKKIIIGFVVCVQSLLTSAQPEICRIQGGHTKMIWGTGFILGETEVYTDTIHFDEKAAIDALETFNYQDKRWAIAAFPPKSAKARKILAIDPGGTVMAVNFSDHFTPNGFWGDRIGDDVLWIKNSYGCSMPYLIKSPKLWFVYPEKAEAGNLIRIFGRNIDARLIAIRKKGENKVRMLKSSAVEARSPLHIHNVMYEAEVRLPEDIKQGEYDVFIHNGSGGIAGWSNPLTLTIHHKSKNPVIYEAVNYGVKANAYTDDTESLRKALNAAAAARGTVILPPGKIVISQTIELPEGVSIRGSGTDATSLHVLANNPMNGGFPVEAHLKKYPSDWLPNLQEHTPMLWIKNNSEISDFSLVYGPGTGLGVLIAGGNGIAENIHIERIRVIANYQVDGWLTSFPVLIANDTYGMVIADNDFKGWGALEFIANNHYQTYVGRNKVIIFPAGITNAIFTRGFNESIIENNEVFYGLRNYSSQSGKKNSERNSMNSKTEPDVSSVHVAMIGNVFVNNPARRHNDGEMMIESGFAHWWGKVKSSAKRSLTLDGVPLNADYSENYVLIIDGKGLGQYRRILSNNKNQLFLDTDWDILPDETTFITIGGFNVEHLWIDNNEANNASWSGFWGNNIGHVVDGQIMRDGGPFYLWGWEPNYPATVAFIDIIGVRTIGGGGLGILGSPVFGNTIRYCEFIDFRYYPNFHINPSWLVKGDPSGQYGIGFYQPFSFNSIPKTAMMNAWNIIEGNHIADGPHGIYIPSTVNYTILRNNVINVDNKHVVNESQTTIIYCDSCIDYNEENDFQALLHKVEVSADLFQPADTIFVTCWFQNIGDRPSDRPLKGFAEFSFGHQRIVENMPKYHRRYWDIYPHTCLWQKGDIWKTTFKCKMDMGWGGTYTIRLGLCDEEHNPVKIIGEDRRLCEYITIGKIDLGWGWGIPLMDKLRKSWEKEINPLQKKTSVDQTKEEQFPLFVVLRDRENDRLIYNTDKSIYLDFSKDTTKDKIIYNYRIYQQKQIAAFSLNFEINKQDTLLYLSNVKEEEGYELLEINMPFLLNRTGKDIEMLSFIGGGRLLQLHQAMPEGITMKYDTRNAAALIGDDERIVLESLCIDDRLILSVTDNGHEKAANIGVVFVNRVRGYNSMASIPVEHDHSVHISHIDASWGNDGWQSVARFLRKDIQCKPKDIYRRALIYKQLATAGPEPPENYNKEDAPYAVKRLNKVITFKNIFETVKKNYNILDGMPQVLYIGGFQKNGFDSSYPNVFETDKRVGTVDELRQFISSAKQYNAILSLHDNYDSDVFVSEYYDSTIVAIDATGQPWMGWFWAGGPDYIIAPYKYAKSGLMCERVKQTIDTYGLIGSYHIDVLTSELLRYDFDPQCPASAEKSLRGKQLIIKEFNKYNIDVTSETLLHPFVGQIGFGLHTRTDPSAHFFYHEQYIPLIDMVYHGVIPYAGEGRGEESFLLGLMRGAGVFVSEEGISNEDIKWIYLHQMPINMLNCKKIDRIIKNGHNVNVIYDKGTVVQVNFDRKTYLIQVDGRIIANDWTSFLPGFNSGVWLAYSQNGGILSYKAPDGWDEQSKLCAVTLTFEGEGNPVNCKIENGNIIIDMPAQMPVKITADNSNLSVEVDFPNGNLSSIVNNWPTGGWSIPEGGNIAKTYFTLAEYYQRIPKPAEIAKAMQITLGEYDYIFRGIIGEQLISPWANPSKANNSITFIADKSALCHTNYFHIPGNTSNILRSPDFSVKPGKTYCVSLQVKCVANERKPDFFFWYDAGLDNICISYYGLPSTNGEWKAIKQYFRVPADMEKAHFTIHFPGNSDEYCDISDMHLYSVSEEEFSSYYTEERKRFPAHHSVHLQTDGKYLASTVAKLEGNLGLPGKPFLIWGVGSSYTNFLDDIEPIRQIIRKRFPNAPEIIYRKRVGSGCPYDYARGWVHTGVLSEHPDLILCYTNGKLIDLEEMLKNIRCRSTADIIIPSLHFMASDSLTNDIINDPRYIEMEMICRKYNAQFVDNRRELADWLMKNNMEIKDILSDPVHQNELGRILICENIARHFVHNNTPAYDPFVLEKKIPLVKAFEQNDSNISFSSSWKKEGDYLCAARTGSSISMRFKGNGVYLIGKHLSGDGGINVYIDGKPLNAVSSFSISFIEPAITNISHTGNYSRASKENGDTGPHGIILGDNVVPQTWEIRMIDDIGNYELTGSFTGMDGKGNNMKPFRSSSGQIIIPPSLWREAKANVKGDYWSFEVFRTVLAPPIPIENQPSNVFLVPLVLDIPYGEHTIEIKTTSDEKVSLNALYIYNPMLTDNVDVLPILDILYGEAINDAGVRQNLFMDMYKKRNSAKSPVCIFVHGGGFNLGDKQQYLYIKMCERFAQAGYASFSINYRLNTNGHLDKSVLDNAVTDVLMAIRYIRLHADSLGVDPDKIFIVGDSAGGGIVINAAYSSQGKKLIRACIDLWGGLCFNRLDSLANKWGQPVNYYPIEADVPPTCIIHGNADEVVPWETSHLLSAELSKLKIFNELHTLDGALHYPEEMADDFIPIMIRFSNTVLKANDNK